jgi:hypothetical protein
MRNIVLILLTTIAVLTLQFLSTLFQNPTRAAPTTPIASIDTIPPNLVNDGKTDNAFAIQAAINRAKSAGGGTITIPPGTYALSEHVKVFDNIRIVGSGMGVSILKPAPNFKDANDPTYGSLFVSHGASNLHFADFTVTGNTHLSAGGAIHINSKDFTHPKNDNQESNIIIQRVQIKDFWGKGIWFGSYAKGETHSSSQITIRDCRFENLFNPANPYEKVDQEFTGDGRMDAIYGLGGAKKVTIADNFFSHLSGNAIRGNGWYYTLPSEKVPAPDWLDVIITGNHIEHTWMGIEFEGYLAGSRSIIANNSIKWMHRPNGAAYGISAGGKGLKITGNSIEQVEQGAIEIGGTGILFHGNTIRISVEKQGTPKSVVKDYNKPATIRAFGVFSATASQFSNNLLIYDPVYDDGSIAASQMWGIALAGAQGSTPAYDDGTTDVVSILSNTFIGFTQRAIQCSNHSTENVYIRGNIFRSRFVKEGEPVILLWGHTWIIQNNVFDFRGAATAGSILKVHTGVQSDNSHSLVSRNTIIAGRWKIQESPQYQAHDNETVSSPPAASTKSPAREDKTTP